MTRHTLRLLPVLVAGAFASTAYASAFQLLEQNASGLGNAYAGSAAVAENASTIFFNPAGMQLLEGRQVSVGLTVVSPKYYFNNGGTTNPVAMGGTAATGPSGDAGHTGLLPNAYISWPLTKDVSVGLGVGAPFGMKTEYPISATAAGGWLGQYQSDKFDIRTVNVNPTISWRANDKLSLGFGLDYQKINAEYVKMTVTGIGTAALGTVKLDDTAWGWNAGLLYQLSDTMRIGFSYRSDIGYKTSGTANLNNGAPTGTATADVRLPATFILSTWQKLTDRWDMAGDISYTKWSSIQQLVINSVIAGTASSDSLDVQFKNTWRVAMGGTYKYSDAWRLRFGVAWDQTPIPDAAHRPVSLPDNDRWWLSFGAQYIPAPGATLDIGYTHLFLRNPAISNNGNSLLRKGNVVGDFSDSADILGVQYSQKF